MEQTFKKLIKKINFSPSNNFLSAKVIKAQIDKKNNCLNLDISNSNYLSLTEIKNFEEKLTESFGYDVNLHFQIENLAFKNELFLEYLNWFLVEKINYISLYHYISINYSIDQETKVTIKFSEEKLMKKFDLLKNQVLSLYKKYGFASLEINSVIVDKNKDNGIKNSNEIKELDKPIPDKKSINLLEFKNDFKKNGQKNKFAKEKIKYKKVDIDLLDNDTLYFIETHGFISDIQVKTIKTYNYSYLWFIMSNYKSAIYCKIKIDSNNELSDFEEKIKNDDYVLAQGKIQYDNYKKQKIFIIDTISKLDETPYDKVDGSLKKRIEFSTRTKMSAMDGITSVERWFKFANKLGYPGIAFLDNNSVQSFPDIDKLAKKFPNIKPIYGFTCSVINEYHSAIWNVNDPSKRFSDQEYVIFDLETTGLSPIFNEIIEFGGLKIKNGVIIDQLEFFVKPSSPIPIEIQKLTNITNEHISNAIGQEEALKKIIKFFGNATLVAHNANFDINFIEESIFKFNLNKLSNSVIDTLVLSKILFPTIKRFKLSNLAKRFNIDYDEEKAHRALQDAKVLFRIFQNILSALKSQNFNTYKDLIDYKKLEFIRSKTHPYEISIIAKNQVGLKELFKLISRISTIDFYEKPKLIFQWLLKNRTPNILIGSGSLFSRLIEKMIFGTRQQIIEEIKFYDYIEIQPIKNFLHLTKSKIKKQDLQEIISFVVNEAKKINKLIIATSDARYINVEEKNFHEVFIYAKGLKGERHPLYSFQETNFVFPSFEFLTTLEMEHAFSFLKDAKLIKEIVIENTHKLFNQIEKIKVIKSKLYPPELSNANDNLKKIVFKNAHNIYGANLPQLILDRINRELTPIIEYKYSVIYWISHLLVKKATNSGYLVGSRGSVGSSFVAFLANITEVNPLPPHYLCPKCKYFELVNDQNVNSGYDLRPKKCNTCKIELLCEGQNISFESFLGFNAEKIPDIDLNFSGENQLTIHNEVKNYFGENHTFRAGTISTIADKTAFGFIKSWIEEKKVNVNEPFINFMVKKIVGTKRTTGQHPGGIIVIPKSFDVEDFTPINYPANDTSLDWKTTHFDFDSIHDNLLKLDLLGHDDPTIIKKLETITNVNVKTDISFKDKNVISLFSSLKALQISSKDINDESLGVCGIPEFGTPFVRKMLKTVKVQNFGDLISISGLSHGTNVWNNNGEELVKKQKLKLNQIISCRDDIMNYLIKSGIDSLVAFNIMEQVKKGAGITFEQEQLLIKANIPIWYIESLKKIKYMFPRAHATAYVMMAFRIAWFKIYHKLAFYATYLSTRIDIFDLETVLMGKAAVANKLKTLIKRNNSNNKTDPLLNKEKELIFILEIINEAYARGIKIANIDLNVSKAMDWTIDEETQSLIPPFIAIDGLGEIAARRIVEARNTKKFVSQKDFLSRTQLNNTIFEKMKKFGILKNLAHKEQISFNFS